MSEPIIVVKSRKHMEHFDIDKLHRSLVATCRSLKTPDGQAEEIAEKVSKGIAAWALDCCTRFTQRQRTCTSNN